MCVEDKPDDEPARKAPCRSERRRPPSGGPTIRELLDQPGMESIEFDPPRFGRAIFDAPDLQ